MTRKIITIDGTEAAAYVPYRNNEVIAIYPITPSSPMGELADEWASRGVRNIWNTVPLVSELQSEAGSTRWNSTSTMFRPAYGSRMERWRTCTLRI